MSLIKKVNCRQVVPQLFVALVSQPFWLLALPCDEAENYNLFQIGKDTFSSLGCFLQIVDVLNFRFQGHMKYFFFVIEEEIPDFGGHGCVIVTRASRRKILVTQLKSGISSTKVLHMQKVKIKDIWHLRTVRRQHLAGIFPNIGMQLLTVAISGHPSSFWSSYWRASQAQGHLCHHCWTNSRMPSGPAA